METMIRRARPTVYAISIVIAVIGLALYGGLPATLRATRLEEYFGFLGLIYIYLALLPSPLYAVCPQLPGKALANRARRAIGITSFIFAALHGSIAFFGLLDGFAGIPFLNGAYLVDLGVSTIALIILFLLAATSFDVCVRMLGPWWKRLHRLLYVAGFLILFHVFAVGADFESTDTLIATLTLLAVYILLILEALRFDLKYGVPKAGGTPRFSYFAVIAVVAAGLLYTFVSAHGVSLTGHAGHVH